MQEEKRNIYILDNEKRIVQIKNIHNEALNLFSKKNQDYGDAFAKYGPVGVIVRMGDKIQRLHSITSNGIIMVNNESIRDTLMDLHNYSAMALMLIDEKQTEKNDEKYMVCESGLGTY